MKSAAVILAVLLVAALPLHAGEPPTAEDVAKAGQGEPQAALDALLELWDDVRARDDVAPEVRTALRVTLRDRWMALRRFGEALPHAEVLARQRASIEDRIRYAEALLGAVEDRVQRGPAISANISPLLADLLTATKSFAPDPGGGLEASHRARIVYVRARGLFLRGRFDDVVAWLERAQLPSLPAGLRRTLGDVLARSHYHAERFGKAAQAFADAGNPRAAAAAWAAGKDAGNTATAYAELIAKTPESEELAQAALRGVRFAGATESFLLLLAKSAPRVRDAPAVLELRGRLLDGSERAAQAEAIWRMLLEKAPERPGARAVLARNLLAGPRRAENDVRDEALALLVKALEADPEDALATGLLWDLAGREYRALWRDSPQRDRYRRCLAAQRALVAARPDDATAWANLGNTLRVGGSAAEALEAYTRARAENPYDPAIESDAGLTLAALGRADDALAAYERSVQLDPGHLAGRQNAARSLWRAGRDAEAAAQLAEGARTSRARGQTGMTYRILMDRTWRTRRKPELR